MMHAGHGPAWYSPGMKKNHRSKKSESTRLVDMPRSIAVAMAKRTQMNLHLLQSMALAYAEDRRTQRRFITTILIQLSQIQTIIEMILVRQTDDALKRVRISEEDERKLAQETDQFILQTSQERCWTALKVIYAEPEPTTQARRTRRKKSA
jgi:hypothetical protein